MHLTTVNQSAYSNLPPNVQQGIKTLSNTAAFSVQQLLLISAMHRSWQYPPFQASPLALFPTFYCNSISLALTSLSCKCKASLFSAAPSFSKMHLFQPYPWRISMLTFIPTSIPPLSNIRLLAKSSNNLPRSTMYAQWMATSFHPLLPSLGTGLTLPSWTFMTVPLLSTAIH